MACFVSLFTYLTYLGDAVTTDFLAPTFDSTKSNLCVQVDGVDQVETVDWDLIVGPNLVRFVVAPVGATYIEILRDTPIANKKVDFNDGSLNNEEDMDDAIDQLFLKLQEITDQNLLGTLNLFGIVGGAWDAQGRRIINLGTPIDDADATTKLYVDGVATQGALAANVGTGVGKVFKQKNGVTFEFKSIAAGSAAITVVNGVDDVTLDVNTGAGGVVPETRLIDTTEGVQGGGDLSANRTHKLDINGLTADATPDASADWVATYDNDGAVHKKVQLNKLGTPGEYILIRDEKAAGIDGGTFTSGAWRIRDLTTIVTDENGGVSLAANVFTLTAGDYEYEIFTPSYAIDSSQARLYNVTDVAVEGVSDPNILNSGGEASNMNVTIGKMTIAGAKDFRVEHICLTTHGTNGFGSGQISGLGASTEVTVYTIVKLIKTG